MSTENREVKAAGVTRWQLWGSVCLGLGGRSEESVGGETVLDKEQPAPVTGVTSQQSASS